MMESKILVDLSIDVLNIILNTTLFLRVRTLYQINPNPNTRRRLKIVSLLGLILALHESLVLAMFTVYINYGSLSLTYFKALAIGSTTLITIFAMLMGVIWEKIKNIVVGVGLGLTIALTYNLINIVIAKSIQYANKYAAMQLASAFSVAITFWVLFFKGSYGQISSSDPILKASAFGAYLSTASIMSTIIFFLLARYLFTEPFNILSTLSSLMAFVGIYGLYVNISPPDVFVRLFGGESH